MSVHKRLSSLSAAAILLITSLSGCGQQEAFVGVQEPSVSPDSDSWEDATDIAVLENDNIRFELNAKTGHFTVTNKKSGNIYTSVPEDETEYISDEVLARQNSELTIEYYGEQTDTMYMYSSDCIEKGGISVKYSENSVRITYTMGEIEKFVPVVLDEKTFESILVQLGSDALRRRLERYYVYTSVKEKLGEYEDAQKKYSVLEKQNLYIIDSLITDIEKDDIALYIADTDFDVEKYEKMLSELGIDDMNVEQSAEFTIPVEYSVTDDGFSVQVLVDRVKESSDDYKLQKITLLEYFSAFSSDNGSFFVPDGSGAIVDFSNGSELNFPFYGEDYSIRRENQEVLSKNLSFPVYGVTGDDKGVFAVVEQAAEVAELNISSKGPNSALNHAFVSFIYRSIDVTDYGANMQIPIYNLFAKTTLAVSPSIRYFLLDNTYKEYKSMAKLYSDYLNEKGIFGNVEVTREEIFLDFICMITEKTSMLGVPYTKRTVLSTLDDIMSSVETAYEAGLTNLSVRLFGYTSYGYEHAAYTEFELDKRIGTKEQLLELKELLETKGGKLYLDADLQFAFRSGNGFSISDDSARYLNRLVVCRGKYDTVTREYTDDLRKYFITPAKYTEYLENFISSLKKNLKIESLPGLSFGSSGLYLGGDYSKSRDIDRTESKDFLENALKSAAGSRIEMAFDNGNAYVLKYANALFNVPSVSSEYDSEKNAVPFSQMVLSGNIPFAGTPWNLASDPYEAWLESALTGAAPYASFITESDEFLFNTPYEGMWYSLSDDNRLEDFINKAKNILGISKGLANSNLISFERSGDIIVAVYSNGKSVYANESNTDINYDGISIPAKSLKMEGN